MKCHLLKTALILGLGILSSLSSPAELPSLIATNRDAGWRQDIDYFAREFPGRQKDFYKLIPKRRFEAEVAALQARVPVISDADIVLDLDRIVCGMGVAHSGISCMDRPTATLMHFYPVGMQWLSDGLMVVSASPEWRALLGGRVTHIGALTPEEALKKVAPYIAHENEAWLQHQSTYQMMVAELMVKEQIAGTNGLLQLTVTKPDGQTVSVAVAPLKVGELNNLVSVLDELHVPTPLCRKNPRLPYWWEYLPASRTLFLQYNRCADQPGHPFEDLAREMFDFAGSNAVLRLVVDLRGNSGGNSEVINPLLQGLRERPSLNARGRLFVLIGPATFSSGEMAAEAFHYQSEAGAPLQATLVGRPTGGKPNCYGEIKSLTLPNSKLGIYYSIKYFQTQRRADPPSLEPDISVPTTIGDLLSGRDPVMEKVLSL